MPWVLGVELAALCDGASRVHLSRTLDADETHLRAALEGTVHSQGVLLRRSPDHRFIIFEPPRRGRAGAAAGSDNTGPTPIFGEAEQKAAARLDVEPETVEATSVELWGRGFTEERDRRVQEELARSGQGPPTPRTLQALRGHVSRRLIVELAAGLGSHRQGGKSPRRS